MRWPFAKPAVLDSVAAAVEPSESYYTADQVTACEQIADLIEQIYRHHCLLAINIPYVDETYTSAIIEVAREKRHIVLDELAPRSGNRHLRTGTRIGIRARLNGATLRFEGEVTALGEDSGLAYYQLPFPPLLDQLQRREYFRAGVPMERHIAVQISTASGKVFSAELRDISLGGFSARVRAAPIEELAPGTFLPACTIILPDQAPIRASGSICYADVWQSTQVSRCGVRFVELDKTDRRMLEQFIAQLDRQTKRRHLNR